jgi:hypothetical protein
MPLITVVPASVKASSTVTIAEIVVTPAIHASVAAGTVAERVLIAQSVTPSTTHHDTRVNTGSSKLLILTGGRRGILGRQGIVLPAGAASTPWNTAANSAQLGAAVVDLAVLGLGKK